MVSCHATKGECASHKSSNNWGGGGDKYIKLKPQQFVKKEKKQRMKKHLSLGKVEMYV